MTDFGHVSYGSRNDEGFTKPFSEATGQKLDAEIHRIINEAHTRTHEMLTKHRAEVEKVALRLLEREVLQREDMVSLLGPRPFEESDGGFDETLGWRSSGTSKPLGGPGASHGEDAPLPAGIDGGGAPVPMPAAVRAPESLL